jgi:hypothetical protein
MGVSGQRHDPTALCPGERTPDTHCTGGWVGLRAGLDTEVRGKILCPCRGSNPNRPVVQSVVRTILTVLPRLPTSIQLWPIQQHHYSGNDIERQASARDRALFCKVTEIQRSVSSPRLGVSSRVVIPTCPHC